MPAREEQLQSVLSNGACNQSYICEAQYALRVDCHLYFEVKCTPLHSFYRQQ